MFRVIILIATLLQVATPPTTIYYVLLLSNGRRKRVVRHTHKQHYALITQQEQNNTCLPAELKAISMQLQLIYAYCIVAVIAAMEPATMDGLVTHEIYIYRIHTSSNRAHSKLFSSRMLEKSFLSYRITVIISTSIIAWHSCLQVLINPKAILLCVRHKLWCNRWKRMPSNSYAFLSHLSVIETYNHRWIVWMCVRNCFARVGFSP